MECQHDCQFDTGRHQPTILKKFMMAKKRIVEEDAPLKKDDLIVITGAGGFVAGNLALHFRKIDSPTYSVQ
jgi:hypothetical protein